jgi:ketosteroid isomerase-like protein
MAVNEAEELLQGLFLADPQAGDVFDAAAQRTKPMADYFHPDVRHALFGPSGAKEMLVGRDAFLAFVARCAGLLSDRHDEIISIIGIGDQCALVHARAWRKSKATGEEIRYEWAMLYRVEDGKITYGADMLDRDAQAFWGRAASWSAPSCASPAPRT